MAFSQAIQGSRRYGQRVRWPTGELPDPSRLAPIITVESVLLWIASSLADCMCSVPPELRLGALGVLVAVWIADYVLRQRLPRVLFALAACLPVGLLVWLDAAEISPIFLLLLVGWIAYAEGRRTSLVVLGLALAMLIPYLDTPEKWLPWSIGVAADWAVVRVMLPRRRQARESSADERRRLARDVHDVIAHSMTVTMLHVTGARHALSTDPQAAAAALAEAERLGRASLADIRRTIRLLGAEGTVEPITTPDLESLVSEYHRAGLDVRLTSTVHMERLSAGARLGLYRIAEEALANAARHAPRARVTVGLTVDLSGGARLRVLNDGPPSVSGAEQGPRPGGSGLGITGMRERAAMLQGELTAGPRGNGWVVECVLPPGSGAWLTDPV